MTITAITDMAVRAQERLIEQFKESTNINLMSDLFVDQVQELETVAIDVLAELTISSATGVNLDIVGDHLGRKRAGANDSDYRDLLRLQIGINTSEGAEQPLYNVFKTLTNSTIAILTETFPAELQLFGDGTTIDASIISQIQSIVAATVQINFLISGGNRPLAFEGGETLGGGFTSLHTADPAAAGDGAFSSLIPGV